MHIVVAGGNGFVGRAFVARLVASGHAVTVASRDGAAPPGANGLAGGLAALVDRPDLLAEADVVCHLASATIPSSSMADPIADIDQNLGPLIALLEAMRATGNRRILFVSSGGAVYGVPDAVPIPEDHPRSPISHYGMGKKMMEDYLDFYAREHGFATAVIRPANPYGPGQGKVGQLGAVTTFFRLIEEGRQATLFGDGSTVRDFVHVDDLAALMLRVVETGASGTWNCGGGVGTSLAELIGLIEAATGKVLAIDRQPARPFDPPAIVLDISRAREELGWVPQVALAKGIDGLLSQAGR